MLLKNVLIYVSRSYDNQENEQDYNQRKSHTAAAICTHVKIPPHKDCENLSHVISLCRMIKYGTANVQQPQGIFKYPRLSHAHEMPHSYSEGKADISIDQEGDYV